MRYFTVMEIKSDLREMTILNHPKISSPGEFFRDFVDVGRLIWRKRRGISTLSPILRETICLAVTFANNCSF